MGTRTQLVSPMMQQVLLRTMELADVQALFRMENDPEVWRYTDQGDAPYTWDEIERFVRTAPRDLLTTGQLRWVIEYQGAVVGTIDLYGYDPAQAQAWVGVLVWPEEWRGRGIGGVALRLLIEWAATGSLARLAARVEPDNEASRRLFLRAGFRLQSESPTEWLFQYVCGE